MFTEDLYIVHSPAMNGFEDYVPPTEWIKGVMGGGEEDVVRAVHGEEGGTGSGRIDKKH